MKFYYNLAQQAFHVASLKAGDTFVIVVPLKEQPPEGCPQMHVWDIYSDFVRIGENLPDPIICDIKLPYPVGSRVGLREAWMPIKAIRNWGIVDKVRVDKVQNLVVFEKNQLGLDNYPINSMHGLSPWFNKRYGEGTWDKNPYCEIVTMRIEK